jgi:hypothetical protein
MGRGPWPLSEDTALGLGLAMVKTFTVIGWDKDGTARCDCKEGRWTPPICMRAERQGKPCETRTGVVREDRYIRLRRCQACRGFFVGHYSMRLCSDACIDANHRAWLDAHRPPARQQSWPVSDT